MKFSEICEKLKSGEFTIDKCGHHVNNPLEYVLRKYNHMVENANGANDGKWTAFDSDKGNTEEEKSANRDKTMRDIYQRDLDRECEVESDADKSPMTFIGGGLESYCFHCGKRMNYSFNGMGFSINMKFDDSLGKYGKFVYSERCELENPKPYKVKIDVAENLVFANWFANSDGNKDDCPEGERYTEKYDLNAMLGRLNIAKWKAENQNIAYAQIGSCGSTAIWYNKDKNHGYITTAWFSESDEFYNEKTKKYDIPKFLKGYKEIGRTEVGVWRVEMGDTSRVDMNQLYKRFRRDEYTILQDTPKGTWEFTSYGDVEHEKYEGILAEFKLLTK